MKVAEMMMNGKRKNIGDLLLEYNLITKNDLEEALKIQKTSNKRLGEILVDLKKVSEDDIQYIISKQLNIPFVFLTDDMIDAGLIKKFSKDFLIENRILPLIETDEYISIATNDPFNQSALDKIKELFKKEVKVSACSSEEIFEKLKKFTVFDTKGFSYNLKDINERLKNSSFYRLDFLFSNNSLDIGAFGSGIYIHLETFYNCNIDYKTILNFFKENAKGVFFNYFKSSKSFMLTLFPVLDFKNIDVINEYGIYPNGKVIFSDLNYVGEGNIFTSANFVLGYKYISFQRFIDEKNAINIIDNYKGDYKGKVLTPLLCSHCGGKKCERCKFTGYIFEVQNGKN